MKTYNIRVRAEYTGYYKVEARFLGEAEAIAQQRLVNEMNNLVDGSFDLEEYDEAEFEADKELKEWAENQ